ncbi:MAG: LysM peptidoglycan-binding domain-containing protein [Verrucomicrobiae bacterium]|nr:LysM peptidoglycan-binding domain-containing protein [Verrucomicrobiae bacterium]
MNAHPPIRPLFIALAASLALLCGCDSFSDNKQALERHQTRAKKAYEQRDYKGAIAEYEEMLRLQPENAPIHFKIAMIYNSNLNDYLNAAYHFQKFLSGGGGESSEAELAKSYLENARLQLAASVPNAIGQGSPEMVKLRSENTALYRQIEDLKKEIVRLRGKTNEPSNSTTAAAAPTKRPASRTPSIAATIPQNPSLQTSSPKLPTKRAPEPVKNTSDTPNVLTSTSSPAPSSSKKPAAKPTSSRTYTIKKGDGIQSIAERFYGDRSKWREIMAANPNLKDPNRLSPGQVIRLP